MSENVMKMAERVIYLCWITIMAVMCVMFLKERDSARSALNETVLKNVQLSAELDGLRQKLTVANASIADLRRSYPGLRKETIAEYKSRGLDNPEEDIITDLGSREELMPFKGVFGARPSFYREVLMWVLNSRWALGAFNDGSNIGYTLYEYKVSETGEITWKVIDRFMSKVSTSRVPSE
ncbi:hypothetical protein ACFL47_07905 [Candidatus Latescibacterota bacterium]